MSNAFAANVSRSAIVNATRVPFAQAADLLARLGTSVEEVRALVGVRARGKFAGEIDGAVWIIDVKEGGWARTFHQRTMDDTREWGRAGVLRPGRAYLLVKGWCDAVVAAHDGTAWCADWAGCTWAGPAVATLARVCKYGCLHKQTPHLPAYDAAIRRARDLDTAEATIDGACEVLDAHKASLAGAGYALTDRAVWASDLAIASVRPALAKADAAVAKARHALIRWTGFAA